MTTATRAGGAAPTVTTPFGTANGTERDGISIFKGIPYGRADRFAHPELITDWGGPLDASTYRTQAPQLAGTMERLLGQSSRIPTGEDCLHLNVFTPACDDARRPVLVWIHGGAFVTGGGAMPWYDGVSLCGRGDVVVVTLNYRLGALGFTGRSNAGLADQVTALQWVREAIASFGGDPGNVTVFGESAGGASVVSLLAAAPASDLFHRAWAMSASIPQLRDVARADAAEAALLAAAGVGSTAELSALPVDDLLTAQAALLADPAGSMTAFAPTPDGTLVPRPITEAAAADPRPLVLGTTRDEMHLFTAFDPRYAEMDDATLHGLFGRRFGEGAPAAIDAYRAHRPGDHNGRLVSAMQTDETFRQPARRLAESREAVDHTTWMYWFTYATPAFGGVLGSCHALDIPFAFHNLDRPGVAVFSGDGDERVAVADEFAGAVLRFARGGEPGWAPYDTERRTTRVIGVESGDVDDPEAELRRCWAT